MVKKTNSEKNGLRKGTWTPEEDKKLIAYVTRYGHWNWNLLPKFAGTSKSLILICLPSLHELVSLSHHHIRNYDHRVVCFTMNQIFI